MHVVSQSSQIWVQLWEITLMLYSILWSLNFFPRHAFSFRVRLKGKKKTKKKKAWLRREPLHRRGPGYTYPPGISSGLLIACLHRKWPYKRPLTSVTSRSPCLGWSSEDWISRAKRSLKNKNPLTSLAGGARCHGCTSPIRATISRQHREERRLLPFRFGSVPSFTCNLGDGRFRID